MSDLKLNFRILFWHLQLNRNWKWRFSFNYFRWEKPCQRWRSIIPPIELIEFSPMK